MNFFHFTDKADSDLIYLINYSEGAVCVIMNNMFLSSTADKDVRLISKIAVLKRTWSSVCNTQPVIILTGQVH